MKNKYLQLFLISNILIILDQFTKYLVALHIPQNMSIRIIDSLFNLTHIRNPGVAFGLFADSDLEIKATLFIVFSGIAIIAILVFFHETPSHKKIALRGLILIFAGAIGNLIDRILYKEVIDFLDFHFGSYHWPAFNVADSCITIGVLFMFIDIIKDGTAPQKRPQDPTSESA